jgi:hypothetical protein
MLRRSLFLLAVGVVSCSSSSSGSSSGATCTEYTSTSDLNAPSVSMKSDIQPIIDRACTFSSCHGGGSGKLTLVQGDASKSRAALVDVAAPENPSMKLVATGDPKNSWLMKKLDGDVCLFKDKCTKVDGDCGDTMPQSGDILAVDERDKFRRWIAQGAKDN